jgi:hypothetical protein
MSRMKKLLYGLGAVAVAAGVSIPLVAAHGSQRVE